MQEQTLGPILLELLTKLYQIKRAPLTIVETGTMYIDTLEPGEDSLVARSTWAIARWIAQNGGKHKLHSIDFSQEHIDVSKRCMEKHGWSEHVQYHCGDSVGILKGFTFPIDFALLDSAIEPEQTLYEMLALGDPHYGDPQFNRMREPALIVIDDIFKDYGRVNKGRYALPISVIQGHKHWGLRKYCAAIGRGGEADNILRMADGNHFMGGSNA